MEQVIIGGYNVVLSATATKYNSLACSGGVWATVATTRKQVVSTPGTLSNLLIELSEAPGTSKSYTFALMKNGTVTDLEVTISGTDTTGLDTDSVAVVAGDVIQLRCVPSGTPTTPAARWSALFEGTNAKESLILGLSLGGKDATQYSPIMQGVGNTSTENKTYQVIPTAGKIKNLYVELSEDPGTAPSAYRFTLRLNGESTALVVTITAEATTGNNTADEIVVAAGDYVNLMIEPLNTPSVNPVVWFGFTFEADTDGESLLLGQSSDTPAVDASEYNHLVSVMYNLAWSAAEANYYQGGQSMTLRKLYVKLSDQPGAGKSYLIGARVNGSTKIAVTIAGTDTTGNNVADTWDVANFDELNMISTPSGAPTARMVYWGLVCYTGPPLLIPTVTTQAVSDISGTTATGNGTIVHTGPSTVTQHGHCWATTIDPTTADSKTINGEGSLGAFTSSITGLTIGQRYYVKAYATNTEGTAYGTNRSFTANVASAKMIAGNLAVVQGMLQYIDAYGVEKYIPGIPA